MFFRKIIFVTLLFWHSTASGNQDTITSKPLDKLPSELIPEISDYDGYYGQFSSFGLSFIRYRTRGYQPQDSEQRYFGLLINDQWRGVPLWNTMGGLSYQTGEQFSFKGLAYDLRGTGIGSLGSSVDYYPRSYGYSRLRASYAISNRTYTHKSTLSYQNQQLPNGWGITLDLAYRTGASLSIDGVWTNGYGGSLSINKSLSPRHDIALTLLYSPMQRANNSPSTQETFNLTQNNLYNANWGWQDGRVRAVRVSSTNQPVLLLTHNFAINPTANLYNSAYISYGENSYSTFNWQGAPNPNPNYYRYLPSFETSETAKEELTQLWKNDQSVSQVDFESLYRYNITTDPASHYIIEDRVRKPLMGGAQTTFNTELLDRRLLIGAGAEIYATHEHRYKQVKDLLGGDYWVDIDYFVESDDDYALKTQNNIAEPNRHVREGDIFGYNYSLKQLDMGVWGSARYRIGESFYITTALSTRYSTLEREGYWEKEIFQGNESLGRSPRMLSSEYLAKLAIEYRLGARLSVGVTGMLSSGAPRGENVMINADYRNDFIDTPANENSAALEFNLKHITNALRVEASLYYTQKKNGTQITHLYSDLYSRFTDMVIRGIDRRYMGVELSAETLLTHNLWLRAAVSIADNRYTSDPSTQIYYNTTGELLDNTTLLYRDRYCSPIAQSVGAVSLNYNPFGWSVSLTLNGYASAYEMLSPTRYMPNAIAKATDQVAFVHQQKLPSGMTLDLFGGKTFDLRNGSRLNLYAGINNITNSSGIISAGYQSSRLVRSSWKYTPRESNYYYALGINGYISLSFIL